MTIQTRDISFVSNGHPLNGYYASPAGSGPFPGVVVIHEIFGLNDNIKDIARRFANEGYAALAADLFAGRNRAVCMARFMAANLFGPLEHGGVKDLKAALTFLTDQPGVDAGRASARSGSAWAAGSPSPGPAPTNGSRSSRRSTAPRRGRSKPWHALARLSARTPTPTSPPRPAGSWTRSSTPTMFRTTSRSTRALGTRSSTINAHNLQRRGLGGRLAAHPGVLSGAHRLTHNEYCPMLTQRAFGSIIVAVIGRAFPAPSKTA